LALLLLSLNNALAEGHTFESVVLEPFQQIGLALKETAAGLATQLAHPQGLQGVVGIVRSGGAQAAQGNLLGLAITLTVSLALLNLLPIPVLDGGKILFGLLEKVAPWSRRLQAPIMAASALLLLVAMVVLNLRDTMALWS